MKVIAELPRPHECGPFPGLPLPPDGTVVECDCGKRWMLLTPGNVPSEPKGWRRARPDDWRHFVNGQWFVQGWWQL